MNDVFVRAEVDQRRVSLTRGTAVRRRRGRLPLGAGRVTRRTR